MSEIKVKSNGLRNELKEIRKSIDKLTEVLLLQQTNKHQVFQPYTSGSKYDPPYIVTSDAQTNKHNESNNNIACCNDDELCKCKGNKPK